MAVPDRPDPNDLVASDWGRWVHDYIAKDRVSYPPMARVTQIPGITVVNVTVTKMTFAATEYDRLGMFDSVQQGFRIPAGEGGVYFFNMAAVFTGTLAASHRWLRIFKNGSAFIGHDVTGVPPSSGEGISLNWSGDLMANQNDLFTMQVYQKSGADMVVKGTFSIRKVAETQ